MGRSGCRPAIHGGDPLCHLISLCPRSSVLSLIGWREEVAPLVGVFGHIVKLLGTIRIADIAPVLSSDSVVIVVVGCDGGPLTRRLSIFELWNERVSLKGVVGGKVQQVDKGGVDVEELSRLPANLPTFDSRSCEDQRNSGPIVPQGILACNFFFSDMIPMVRPEDYNGIFFQATCPEGGQ